MQEKKEKERKHYAGRWICQKPANKCKGTFSVYGEQRPCPLADRCLQSKDFRGQLEYVWPMNNYKKLIIQSEQDWDKKHLERRRRAESAFCREELNAYYREYFSRPEVKAKRREAFRTKYDPPFSVLIPGYVPKGVKEEMPPCGGDCRNGPYPECPDKCRYEDWEGPLAKRRRYRQAYAPKKALKRKEKMENDPEYRARENAKASERHKRDRARKKEIMKKNAKGGTYHGE